MEQIMISIGIVLGVAFTGLEIYTVKASKILTRLYEKGLWKISPEMVSVVFSLALSALVGAMFPAVGGGILAAAVFSTMFSLGYWSYERKLREEKGMEVHQYWSERRRAFKASVARNSELFQDIWKLIRWTLRVITFPIWGYRNIKEKALAFGKAT